MSGSLRPVYPGHDAMRGRVGVVVPAWFAADTPVTAAAQLLLTTLEDNPCCLRPGDICVVVDGSETARQAVAALGRDYAWGLRVIDLSENRGKGGAVIAGVRALLEGNPELRWMATRDADGDHAIDDLPHLFRTGEQVAEECPGRPVCVIGRRSSVHAPLGWVRGEYELLLNEALVEAVAFALARSGNVWDTRYLVTRAPDLQSGYKLYSRDAAERAVAALDEADAAYPELGLARTGMEVVPFVSLALAGGVFAEVERKAFHDQPLTSYGSVDFTRFYGAKLAWALRTCGVPVAAAAVLFDSAAVHRPLFTDPSGRSGILALRRFVLETLAGGSLPAALDAEPRSRRFL